MKELEKKFNCSECGKEVIIYSVLPLTKAPTCIECDEKNRKRQLKKGGYNET
jgi:hypothetical protein